MIKLLKIKTIILSQFFIFIPLAWAQENLRAAITQPIPIAEIHSFDSYPIVVKKLITQANKLAEMNLTYRYGSADPKLSGMDCSGTIYYLLKSMQMKDVPRDSFEMYRWALNKGKFYPVNAHVLNSSEFNELRPGDLLFWAGTYPVKRNPPISHVMIYLGRNNQGEELMFGASNGRSYHSKRMWGVSVFDFKLPKPTDSTRFVGYSCIPGLTCN